MPPQSLKYSICANRSLTLLGTIRTKLAKSYVTRDWRYGWGTVYAIVEDKDNHFHEQRYLHQIFDGTKKMMGVRHLLLPIQFPLLLISLCQIIYYYSSFLPSF